MCAQTTHSHTRSRIDNRINAQTNTSTQSAGGEGRRVRIRGWAIVVNDKWSSGWGRGVSVRRVFEPWTSVRNAHTRRQRRWPPITAREMRCEAYIIPYRFRMCGIVYIDCANVIPLFRSRQASAPTHTHTNTQLAFGFGWGHSPTAAGRS